MARIHEYQGKRLLKEGGFHVPQGEVASTPAEAERIAKKIGKPVAIKSQIWVTGRLKAGGIKFAKNPTEAKELAKSLLGAEIKGAKVEKVLVEEQLEWERQFYAGIIIDDSYKVKGPVVMFSTEGGSDIEEVASRSPNLVASTPVDIFKGLSIEQARAMIQRLPAPESLREPLADSLCKLYGVFRKYDARTVEVNPLIQVKDGRLYAADCRVSIDDASVIRHPEFGIEIPRESSRVPTELDSVGWSIEEGDFRGISYFMEESVERGEVPVVGYHGMGGGGALLGADALVRQGLKLANYADTSGNPPATKVYRCAKVILSQPGIDGYVAMDPNISSQEMWHTARGLVRAFREDLKDKPGFPIVVLWAGNREDESTQILKEGLKDLPVRLEVYQREHIYNVDFVASRVKALVDEYRKSKSSKATKKQASAPASKRGAKRNVRV